MALNFFQRFALFFARISIFFVLFMFTLDKMIDPERLKAFFEHFSLTLPPSDIGYVITGAALAVMVMFLLGLWKRWTYAFVIFLHFISKLPNYPLRFDFLTNAIIIFQAFWPLVVVYLLLYSFREEDTFLTLCKTKPND